MALRFDLSLVRDSDDLYEDREATPTQMGGRYLNVMTEGLVVATMGVGLGEITEKNLHEFYARLCFIQKLHGPFVIQDGKAYSYTVEDLRRHIGLTTNVVYEARATWLRRFNYWLDDRVKEAKRMSERVGAA